MAMTITQFVERAKTGAIFTVEFIKRTTQERRVMNCRMGVVKHLKGGDASYDFGEKKLLPVFDMEKKGYRSVNLDDLLALRMDGKKYVFRDGQFVEDIY